MQKNALNSRKTAMLQTLDQLFAKAPNMAAKTIRLFPHNSLSMLTEGLGEIYDVKAKTDNYENLNDIGYKWKIKGNAVVEIRFAGQAPTGDANGLIGRGKETFQVWIETDYYNPNDVFRVQDGTQLFVLSDARYVDSLNAYEYDVQINGNNLEKAVRISQLEPGRTTGYMFNLQPEMSEKGYIKAQGEDESHINYLSRIRHSWSTSGDAASTKYIIEDLVNFKGKKVKNKYITDHLEMHALEIFHHSKEYMMIFGESTMTPDGKCLQQDGQGRDIEAGDGVVNQMHPSTRQTYNRLTVRLLEDIMSDMAHKMEKKTGNEILLATGMEGYKEFGRLMRQEHKYWNVADQVYVNSRNGKIKLGGEYNAYTFQGNTIIVTPNSVFDHPALPTEVSADGRRLASSTMMFLDMSTYDGVKNVQLVAKDGRSFVMGEIDGLGGQDGKTSGKISTPVDGSSKHILGQVGAILHNPYSSYILERKNAAA
jgi:hypothetical protein